MSKLNGTARSLRKCSNVSKNSGVKITRKNNNSPPNYSPKSINNESN